MRILYLVHQFFPKYYTGTERFTLDLARQMQRMGHRPTIITYSPDEDSDGFQPIAENVLAKKYTYSTIPVISLKHKERPDSLEILDLQISHAFKELKLDFDLVHVCHPIRLASIARACKSRGVPMIMTLTDSALLCPRMLIDRNYRLCNGPELGRKCMASCGFGEEVTARYKEAKFLFDSADVITAGSKFLAALFEKNGWTRPIMVVPHSVDYSYVERSGNSKHSSVVFGYIGSIAWHKGVHVLISAFRQTRESNIRLRIHGSLSANPSYAKELSDLAEGDSRIEFMGDFDLESTLSEVMQDVSVLVIPSNYYENYPLVMLLALAYRVPVIASRIGGIPEAIQNGYNGLLYEIGNVQKLANIFRRLANRPDEVETLRKNITAPRRIEEEALDYENIYTRLC